MSASDRTMQSVADMIDAPIDRPAVLEITALDASYLPCWQSGLYPAPQTFAKTRHLDRRFTSTMEPTTRNRKISGGRDALARTVLKP
jgi:glycerol kinase